jgi:hypothetical protein
MRHTIDDGICADCETIQQSALNATIRHFQADSRLKTAKLIAALCTGTEPNQPA